MPRISEFFGIAIYMYYEDTKQHHSSHIHVRYAGQKASFSIESGEVLSGAVGPKQERRVRQWIEARRAALNDNWKRAQQGEALTWIDPL